MNARLAAQMAFLMEADRLKEITRANVTTGSRRPENSAEHSWHLALFALVLSEYADEDIDLNRVIVMLLLHDLVEIDAGDHPLHAEHDHAAIAAEEARAADRLFGLLPDDQAAQFRAIWEEFEAAETREARFAKALDRFQPPTLNLATDGASWVSHGADWDKVQARVSPAIARGAPALWDWIGPQIEAWFAENPF